MQNLTLAIDGEVLLRARRYALDHRTTVNQLVRDYLNGLGSADTQRRAAREHWLSAGKKGRLQIGARTWTREQLYDR